MSIPKHLSYFYRKGQTRFEVLSDLDESLAEEILKRDLLWRGDGTYLQLQAAHEQLFGQACL